MHKDLLNRIYSNLAELNRMMERHDLNRQVQESEAAHARESQDGQNYNRLPMIKFLYNDQPQWVSRADVIRAYTAAETHFDTGRVMTPAKFILITRDLDITENDGSYSYHYYFRLDDPNAKAIMTQLDNQALDLNAGSTQPLEDGK